MKKKSKIIFRWMHRCSSPDRSIRMEYLVQRYQNSFRQLPDHTAGKHLESQRQFIHQTQRSVS